MEVPLKVKVISILGMVLSVAAGIYGILMVFGLAGNILSIPGEIGAEILGFIIVGVGIFTILMSTLTFFLSYNLGKLKNWARIGIIILSGLSVLSSLQNLFGKTFLIGLVQLAISGYIVWCLGFDEEVKRAF